MHSNTVVWCFKILEGTIFPPKFQSCSVADSYCMELKWQTEMFWLIPDLPCSTLPPVLPAGQENAGRGNRSWKNKVVQWLHFAGHSTALKCWVIGCFPEQIWTQEFCSNVIVPVFTQGNLQGLTAAHKESENIILKWRTHEGTGKKIVLPLLGQCAGILLLTKAFALGDIT